MDKFDTHKFLYTLFHEGRIAGKKVIFVDRDNKDSSIVINSIEIGASTVSCKICDSSGRKVRVPFVRIKSVFEDDEMIWENPDVDVSNMKIIRGFKKGDN